jgi:hypothetical protein
MWYQCYLIFKHLLLGDFTLPGAGEAYAVPKNVQHWGYSGFSLNVTAQWSTIFKHAVQICFIRLGFCCKISCKIRPKNLIPDVDRHQLSTTLVVHPPRWCTFAEFHPKFDTKRKILFVLSQSREHVYTLYDVKQRGSGALLTNELAVSIQGCW